MYRWATVPVPLATAYCKTLSARASPVGHFPTRHHPQLSTLLFSRPLSCPPLLRASSCGSVRASPPASVLSFFFPPGRCSISPIEPDLFAPCFGLVCSALLGLTLLGLVFFHPTLLMRICEQSYLLEPLRQTQGTVRRGQLLCDSSLLWNIPSFFRG